MYTQVSAFDVFISKAAELTYAEAGAIEKGDHGLNLEVGNGRNKFPDFRL